MPESSHRNHQIVGRKAREESQKARRRSGCWYLSSTPVYALNYMKYLEVVQRRVGSPPASNTRTSITFDVPSRIWLVSCPPLLDPLADPGISELPAEECTPGPVVKWDVHVRSRAWIHMIPCEWESEHAIGSLLWTVSVGQPDYDGPFPSLGRGRRDCGRRISGL